MIKQTHREKYTSSTIVHYPMGVKATSPHNKNFLNQLPNKIAMGGVRGKEYSCDGGRKI